MTCLLRLTEDVPHRLVGVILAIEATLKEEPLPQPSPVRTRHAARWRFAPDTG